jgi:AraC-like DNA-binding protein/predicted transcriptional regulator YdeE
MAAWQSIQVAVDWIENHLTDEISIRDLAEAVHLSPYYFQRLFRKLVGKTVMEYVKLRRLARVSNRLIFNLDTISCSCYHYGFENHETFCKTFKKEYGMTPTEFRKHTLPVCHFPKPVLTEKGLYHMEYEVKIEELGEIEYLAIPHLISMDDNADSVEESKKFWERCFRDDSIKRLKEICGSDEIYALFCNTYDPSTKMVSYDIACVNRKKAVSAEFRAITIRPSEYAVFSGAYKAPMTMGQAYSGFNDIFWGEWLPKKNYKSVIDEDWKEGSASIELYDPPNVDAEEFTIKIWYPITEKEV